MTARRRERPGSGRSAPPAGTPALVVAHQRGRIRVRTGDGKEHMLHAPRRRDPAVAGDRVLMDPATGVLVEVLPRHSLLARPAYGGESRPVAANVDLIVIVVAPVPPLDEAFLDRCLVVASHCGITALVACNKADLLDDAAPEHRRLAPYRRAGYGVLEMSARSGAGIDALRRRLEGINTVLAGASGVGKSSLAVALTGVEGIRTAALAAATRLGRHTTSSATLYPLPGGGHLVDSPGVRDFGVWNIEPRDIAAGFREFRPWLGRCRFRDCRHLHEPGCAVAAACAAGEIAARRLASYRRMLQAVEGAVRLP